MENNFKNELEKLCNMQIALWNGIRNDLAAMDNPTDKDVSAVFHTNFCVTHHKAISQLIQVKMMIDKIDNIKYDF
jgi:hypothetical protein